NAKLKLKGIMLDEGKSSKKSTTNSEFQQIGQKPLSTQMQASFVRSSLPDQTLQTEKVNILQSRGVMPKESRDKSGLGSIPISKLCRFILSIRV
ncbi:hypothetical protein ACR2XN_28560, partial [Klebsiella pneumoniae]